MGFWAKGGSNPTPGVVKGDRTGMPGTDVFGYTAEQRGAFTPEQWGAYYRNLGAHQRGEAAKPLDQKLLEYRGPDSGYAQQYKGVEDAYAKMERQQQEQYQNYVQGLQHQQDQAANLAQGIAQGTYLTPAQQQELNGIQDLQSQQYALGASRMGGSGALSRHGAALQAGNVGLQGQQQLQALKAKEMTAATDQMAQYRKQLAQAQMQEQLMPQILKAAYQQGNQNLLDQWANMYFQSITGQENANQQWWMGREAQKRSDTAMIFDTTSTATSMMGGG